MKASLIALLATLLLSLPNGAVTAAEAESKDPASPAKTEQPQPSPLHIHILSGSKEYQSEPSLKQWKQRIEERYSNVRVTASWGQDGGKTLPELEPLDDADVMVVFLRRNSLPREQLERIVRFWETGKAVIGIRTAGHAFDRETNKTFDAKVLGGSYSGHGKADPKIEVQIPDDVAKHPVLAGVKPWTRPGKLYRNPSNAKRAVTLLVGKGTTDTQPLAWVYERDKDLGGGRSFYTAMGYPHDFENASFQQLLANAIEWTTQRELVAKEDAAGASDDDAQFVSLFDGKTLTGWHNPYDWGEATVVDGEIHLRGERKWFLITDRTYANFELEAEVRMPEKGKANSGVMFRAHQKKNKVWGYQAEVDPSDRAWSGGLYDEGRRGWINPKRGDEASVKAFKAQGDPLRRDQWNHYRIRAVGDRLQIWVNGTKMTDLRDDTDAEGHIGIQHHGEKGQVYRFRGIRIRQLPAERTEAE